CCLSLCVCVFSVCVCVCVCVCVLKAQTYWEKGTSLLPLHLGLMRHPTTGKHSGVVVPAWAACVCVWVCVWCCVCDMWRCRVSCCVLGGCVCCCVCVCVCVCECVWVCVCVCVCVCV